MTRAEKTVNISLDKTCKKQKHWKIHGFPNQYFSKFLGFIHAREENYESYPQAFVSIQFRVA